MKFCPEKFNQLFGGGIDALSDSAFVGKFADSEVKFDAVHALYFLFELQMSAIYQAVSLEFGLSSVDAIGEVIDHVQDVAGGVVVMEMFL